MNNEKAKYAKRGGEKLRIQKSPTSEKRSTWFGRFMTLLKVKVHYREIEVCYMSSQFRRTIN